MNLVFGARWKAKERVFFSLRKLLSSDEQGNIVIRTSSKTCRCTIAKKQQNPREQETLVFLKP